jgi:hypothetical protein
MARHPTTGWDTPYKVHDQTLLVDQDERIRRISFCEECPRFRNFVCKENKTFLPPKTWLTFSSCPQNKW